MTAALARIPVAVEATAQSTVRSTDWGECPIRSLAHGTTPSGQALPARRLVAVLHADMAGYSKLIGIDDVGTLQRFRALRDEVIIPSAATYGGRIVHIFGDEFLLEFASATQAVSCGLWLQQQILLLDRAPAPALQMRFRIGVDIGEVLSDGSDIHGEGVNVAARLQAVAPVGGVCVSRTVRDQIAGCLDVRLRPIGSLRLKHIARPIEAFSIAMGRPQRPDQRRLELWRSPWRKAAWIGLVAFLAVAPKITGFAGAESHIAMPSFGRAPAVADLPPENLSSPTRLTNECAALVKGERHASVGELSRLAVQRCAKSGVRGGAKARSHD